MRRSSILLTHHRGIVGTIKDKFNAVDHFIGKIITSNARDLPELKARKEGYPQSSASGTKSEPSKVEGEHEIKSGFEMAGSNEAKSPNFPESHEASAKGQKDKAEPKDRMDKTN